MKKLILFLFVIAFLLPLSCTEDEKTGSIQFYIEPEWTIVNGIPGGHSHKHGDGEEIEDGWSVTYNDFIVSIGDITVGKAGSEPKYRMNNHYIVDLKNAPTAGLLLAEFNKVPTGHWDRVGYSLPAASAASQVLGNVPQDMVDLMKTAGLAVYTRMEFKKNTGRRCPYLVDTANPADPDRPCEAARTIIADWELPYPSKAEGCRTPSEIGLTVPSGGTVAAKVTIHADHFFFTAFRHTEVTRLVQHIVDADLDEDGEVTMEELAAVPITVLDTTVFDLSTVPVELESLLDYVRWAVITFPHFQGDGGCPERTPL